MSKCSSNTMQATATVLSKGLAATPNFFPMTPFMDASQVTKGRGAVEMRGDTSSALLAAGFQTANDPDVLDAAVLLGALAYLGAEGIQYPTAWTDLTNALAGKQVVRFGALVKQDADGPIQGCQASIKIDIQGP